jgi:F0F1-type ATP synthase membrane subunit b/b'
VDKVQALCRSSKAFAANTTEIEDIEGQLESTSHDVKSRLHSKRAALVEKYDAAQKKTDVLAKAANGSASANSIEAALAELRNVSNELSALDKEQRHQMSKALGGIRDKALGPWYKAIHDAVRVAAKTTDPLYGMGDAAENQADKLNDARVDAANCATSAIDSADVLIKKKADEIDSRANGILERDADTRSKKLKQLQMQVDRAAARQATFDAVLLASPVNQQQQTSGSVALIGVIAFTVVSSAVFTGLLMMRALKPVHPLNSPLLPQ